MDNNKTPLCFLFSVPCILFNQLISPSFSYTSRFPFSYTHRPSIPSSSHSYSDKSNYKISPKFPSKTHKLNLKNHFYLCHFVIVPFNSLLSFSLLRYHKKPILWISIFHSFSVSLFINFSPSLFIFLYKGPIFLNNDTHFPFFSIYPLHISFFSLTFNQVSI